MKKRGRIWWGILLCMLFVGCGKEHIQDQPNNQVQAITVPLEKTLEVAFLDVEKADCIVLTDGTQTVIIDAGYGRSIDIIAPYLEEKHIDTIDYLILTHFDKDHIGSADHILDDYEVKNLLLPNYISDTKQYTQLMGSIEGSGVTPTYIKKTTELSVGEGTYVVHPAMKEAYREGDNDFSLVISLTYGNHRYFFAGDAEKERIDEVLTQVNQTADVLKMPHHGHVEKNTEQLIKMIKPKYAIITDSEEEPADDITLDLLKENQCETYRTTNGSVHFIDNGVEIKVEEK